MKKEKQPKPKIVPGYTVGNLTVAEATDQRKNGYMVWKCCCSCGGTILLDTRSLQRGCVRDCGCETRVAPGQKNLTGQRFGQLTCLEPTENRSRNGSLIWRCCCDCGAICSVSVAELTSGNRKSCGCLSRPSLKDFVGKQFGQLTVTAYAGKQRGMHRWRCLCTCGKETTVGQTLLQTGKTKSCGCLQASMAEKNMKFVEGTSVTLLEHSADRKIATNSSGHNGIYLNKKTQKWIAQIGFKGKNYYLGSYVKLEDAVKARKKAEERMYGEFLEWYYEMLTEENE